MKKYLSYFGASLVAIAALSSCNKELTNPDEVIKGGVPFEITAASVDTKTSIDDLTTSWVADDAINLFHAVAGTTTYTSDGQFTITADNLASNKFTGTLASELVAGNYDWYAIYPYKEQISSPADQTDGYVYIGHSVAIYQNGNDSKAHLCGSPCPLYGVSKSIDASSPVSLEMKHLTSVVEINVTNSTDEPLTVSSISFSTDEDIVGSYYINFAGETVVYNPSDANYVKTVANLTVQNGTALAKGETASFYIPIKPHVAENGSVITITVNGYEKTISLTKDVTFTAGKIKKVNFDFDNVQTTYTWDLSVNSTTEATEDRIAWTNDVADMVCVRGEGGTAANNYYPGASSRTSTRFYSKNILSITPKAGKVLTYYVFEATTTGYATALANSTWTNAEVVVDGTTVTVIANDPSAVVSAVIGATCGFTKVECHTDAAPVYAPIITANPTSIEAPAAGDVCTILYSIKFPVDGKSISATSDQSWVNTFDYSTTGRISFVVDANSGDARIATVTLSYEGAENVVVSISQKAAGTVSEKEIEIVGNFTSVDNGLSLTYQGITITQLKGTSSTSPNTNYATATTLRVYDGNTLTFSSDKTITKIVFTHTASYNGGSDTTADVGTYTRGTTSSTWTGSASEVTITNAKGSSDTNNIQIRPTKIVVTVLE